MDLKRKLVGALFAVIAASGLLIACGTDEESCEFDTDCEEGAALCHDGFCEPSCEGAGQGDCYAGEICTPRPGLTGSVCLSDGGGTVDNNGETPECTENEQCDSGVCNQDTGKCEDLSAPSVYTVLVRDTTTDTGRCGDTTDGELSAGTKLTYVALKDASGTNIGYGKEIGYDFGENTAYNEISAVLDGSAPNLNGQCAESFTLDNGVALGCGGWVMVQFDDSSGNRIELSNDHDVFVGVHANQCDALFDKDGLDKYEVALCTTSATTALDTTTCTVSLASGINGLKAVPVELP